MLHHLKGHIIFERVVEVAGKPVKLCTHLFWAKALSPPRSFVKQWSVPQPWDFLAHDWPMASNQVGFCCGNTSRTVNKHLFVLFPVLILDFLTFNKLLVVLVTCLIPSPGGSRARGLTLKKKETIRNPVSWSWMELDGGLVWSSNRFQRLRCPKSRIFDTFLEVYLLSNRISGPNSFS